ncbi:MAG: hypothetical protein EBR87_10100, partial [Cytophagia bacterium]|nr:hypothetical protein [Cytophagia bacterium]
MISLFIRNVKHNFRDWQFFTSEIGSILLPKLANLYFCKSGHLHRQFKIKGYSFHLILVPGRIIRIANRRDVVEIEFGQITHRFDLSKCKTNKLSCV